MFSFGENDVCVSLCSIPAIMRELMGPCYSDLRTNAQRARDDGVCSAKEISGGVRVHVAAIPWTWDVKLYVAHNC